MSQVSPPHGSYLYTIIASIDLVQGRIQRGGFWGCNPPPPNGPSLTYTMQYYSTAWCAGALIYIAKSMIVSLVLNRL